MRLEGVVVKMDGKEAYLTKFSYGWVWSAYGAISLPFKTYTACLIDMRKELGIK